MPPRKRGALAAVPDEPAPTKRSSTKRPPTVSSAADTGTRRDVLVAQRRVLAKAIDDPDTRPRELAQLSRQMLAIDQEVRAIDAATTDEEAADDFAVESASDEAWDNSAI
ncbi:hypothetical protein ACFWQG_13100 [Rhodococcus sp. NPDC058532]|uniref:hypothetical protein n=1 Tax=Rhodococcus sp. NPDC058532 TaxID=3346540 RepID=UPI00364B6A8D